MKMTLALGIFLAVTVARAGDQMALDGTWQLREIKCASGQAPSLKGDPRNMILSMNEGRMNFKSILQGCEIRGTGKYVIEANKIKTTNKKVIRNCSGDTAIPIPDDVATFEVTMTTLTIASLETTDGNTCSRGDSSIEIYGMAQ